jgi:hypothetical protein
MTSPDRRENRYRDGGNSEEFTLLGDLIFNSREFNPSLSTRRSHQASSTRATDSGTQRSLKMRKQTAQKISVEHIIQVRSENFEECVEGDTLKRVALLR